MTLRRLLAVALTLAVPLYCIAATHEIEVQAGFDGSNPQEQAEIVREAALRFRVRTFNEEGSNDHYWFRLNVRVVNHTYSTQDVEMAVEWPALENFPGHPYDVYYYGDKGAWRWTRATVEGTTAYLVVPAPPGETYVGFYPRYSYGQYVRWIESLPESPFLEHRLEGKSYFGRDIRSLRITDPAVPDEAKKTVLITARNHPYETGGSYIAEEMVRWLTGDEGTAPELRRGNVIYLLPMMNPDGVALGCNQRTRITGGVNISYGVESDDPAVTTLLAMVRRVRPALWADIHSWPHKDDDGMWCTHRWVADGLLEHMPEGVFGDYVWNLSFVREGRTTPEDHLWQWLIREFDSGGVSFSFTWFRRTEQDLAAIARRLAEAVCLAARGGGQ